MSKKNIGNKPTLNYSAGDMVYIPDIAEIGRIIGRSFTKKDYYVIELNQGGIELFTPKELEKTSAEGEYNKGLYEGEKYGNCIVNELTVDVQAFAEERSRDYAEGYLHSVVARLTNISDNIDLILQEQEEE
jgi:hypothetical protein